jgi:hypothetical protein
MEIFYKKILQSDEGIDIEKNAMLWQEGQQWTEK